MILEFEDEKRLLDDATRELMQTCSQAAQKAEGVTLPLSVFIRVVDDDEIRAINASSGARTLPPTCFLSRR
ncbi:MAG: hypothetical protein ACLTBF_03925 [Christensenellales bacterium]